MCVIGFFQRVGKTTSLWKVGYNSLSSYDSKRSPNLLSLFHFKGEEKHPRMCAFS